MIRSQMEQRVQERVGGTTPLRDIRAHRGFYVGQRKTSGVAQLFFFLAPEGRLRSSWFIAVDCLGQVEQHNATCQRQRSQETESQEDGLRWPASAT